MVAGSITCESVLSIGIPIAIAFVAGKPISWLLDYCASGKRPPSVQARLWEALQRSQPEDRAGLVLGIVERLLALYVGWLGESAYLLLGGYLTFKLGSKWPVWTNVFHYPDTLTGEDVTQLEYMNASRLWGSMALMRFLIGTTVNIVLGVLLGHFVIRGLSAGPYL